MALTLQNLKPAKGSYKRKKRIGRGNASGHGTYSGKGQKGQRARSGGRKGLKLKGFKGQMLKIPKNRGFKSIYSKMAIINLSDLEKNFKEGEVIEPISLLKSGLIKDARRGVKILGQGKLTKKVTVKNCSFSQSAEKAVNEAGGTVLEPRIK